MDCRPTTAIENKEGRQLFQNSYRVQEATDNHYWICTSHGLYMLDARTAEFHRFFLSEREDSIYGYATNAIIDYPKPNHKLVTTDGFNSYVVNTVTQGWKRKKNHDLWAQFDALSARFRLEFTWIKGHAGHPENERCDRLAVEAYSLPFLPPDEGYEAITNQQICKTTKS